MSDLFAALALAVAVEGIAYALFPDGMKRMMAIAMEPRRVSGTRCNSRALALHPRTTWPRDPRMLRTR